MVRTTDLKEKLRDSANVADKVLSRISPDQDSSQTTKSFLNLSTDVLKKFQALSSIKVGCGSSLVMCKGGSVLCATLGEIT